MNRQIKTNTNNLAHLLMFIAIFISIDISAQCPEMNETHNLKSQAEVDSFLVINPNCTYLQELELSGDVSDISGFSSLTSVSYLYIGDCPNLSDLMGFSNIDSIFDNLGFYGTQGLTSLCGLKNLSYIGRDLRMINTQSIENLYGIENLTAIGDDIQIEENVKLESLSGLQNVSILNEGTSVTITDNPMLINCCGVQDIVINTIDLDLDIENNPSFCSNQEEIVSISCGLIETTCVTSTSEETALDIKIFPNPASKYLMIENNTTKGLDQLLMYNSIGQRVVQIENPSTSIPIDLLSNGIYVVEIKIGDSRILNKIIVQN